MERNLLYVAIFFLTHFGHAQYNPDAPWMKSLNQSKASLSKRTGSPLTFNEIVSAFDTFWKDKDANKKGSGHKPFKRWENYWKNFVKEDGTLPNSRELWDVWIRTQEYKQSSLNADLSNWQPIGPTDFINTGSWSSGIGRINAIIVDPNDSNTYYAGAPAGGIWKSINSGSSWVPLSDNLPQIGVSGIAIDYSDSDIIYIATGDDDNGDTFSIGVMKSTDGGTTWNTTGLSAITSEQLLMNDIYIHPSNSNILWVATSRGVYKTIDAGVNWSNINGTQNLNIKDIKLKPGDPDTIYAVTTNTFYISTDAGETFTNSGFGAGLPLSSNRLVIDVTPDNNNVIYVLSSASDDSFQGLYKSTNSGVTFIEMDAMVPATKTEYPDYNDDLFDHSIQAYYDMALAVADSDENEVYVGVLNIWKSTNGGDNFEEVNEWHQPSTASYSHADIHLLRFYNGALFAGTDGGFYRTTDGGTNFTDLTAGLQIGQFYRLTVSKESSEKMIGGLQDNGGYAYNNSNTWLNYYGADGMDTAINPDNSNLMYGFIQYGSGLYGSANGGNSRNLVIDAPADEVDEENSDQGGNWVTPLMMNRDGNLYAAYSSLYELCGGYWSRISSNFGSNNNIDVLEIDEVNPDNIFIALNNDLHKSSDKGSSFTNIESFSSNITSIEVNNNTNNIVYVTTSGSTGGVYKSIDGGLTFSNITGSLPNITKNIIKHQNLHSQNPLFLGTSLGVYRYDDTVGDWEAFENNLPNVSVTDLEININDGNITAATYGRGVWQTTIPTETISDEISLEALSDIHEVVACGSSSSAKALVKNRGTNTVSSITINYSLNGNPNNTIWNGSLSPDSSVFIDIPSMVLFGTGLQEVKVNATTSGDTFSSNNELITSFYSNESGLLNVVNEFESTSDELVTFDDNSTCAGYWERGEPTGTLLNMTQSGTNVYGTNLSGAYGNNLKSYLVSKCYDLSILTNPLLKFYMAFDLELNYDIMYVEYSIDNGLNWQILGTANDVNWYNSSTLPGSNCYNCPGAQWTGADTTMKEYSYNLSALNNETNIIFRFVFHSDEFTTNEGVIIDDFSIEGTLSSDETPLQSVVYVYPNPAHNLFNISVKHINSFYLNVTDITGKTIMQKYHVKNTNGSYKLDMSGYASGIYFLNINSEIGTATKKLLLK
ncbi:T9SS type A sorting domain-containing protein [Seonamhaeicola sediminis]|uniref:T9SS type A sorting domain-containing protein n=1 Tax=Seonamhaeicola sediminis TaxID=2528206 RepID=A0A562YAY6_9FLAO|nr:T9SS type A sorting domain-containing protein [Seonamhaeicola sediminis]TWO31553.1 T9SS type A sorting domain-containing protein [Seonamhaeicola sediminis]